MAEILECSLQTPDGKKWVTQAEALPTEADAEGVQGSATSLHKACLELERLAKAGQGGHRGPAEKWRSIAAVYEHPSAILRQFLHYCQWLC